MPIKDEDRSVRVEPKPKPKKKKPVAPVRGEQAGGVAKTPVPFKGQATLGADWGPNTNNVFDLNRRAELATASYHSLFGVEPSPGLLYDLVRSPVPTEEFEELLKVPMSFAQAQAQAEAGREEPADEIEAHPVVRGLRDAIRRDAPGTSENYDAYVRENADELNALAAENPAEFEYVVEKYQKQRSTEQGQPTLQLGGPGTEPRYPMVLLPFRAAAQVSEALVYAPAGAYEVGKALGFDVADAKGGDLSFSRSRELGGQVVEGVKQTYSDPLENPGFIFMDALGLVSGGAGAASRISRASKATGVRAKLNALSRRANPGTYELGGEQVLLSQNVAARAVQNVLNGRRERALEKRRTRQNPEFAPLPQKSIFGRFQTEAKVGREAAARQRVEKTIAMEPVRELEAIAGWSINSARAFSRMPKAMKRGLSRGEQKAIQVLLTDEPGGWEEKLALHRSFHERMLEQGVGDPKAHTRQLADLQLAEKALQKPRSRFEKAVALVDEVSREGELLKVERLGLDADGARARIANFANVMRHGELDEGAILKTDTARYVPSVPVDKSRRRVGRVMGALRGGRFGIPHPRNLPELTHQFTGDSVRWGNTRIDTTNLVGESYSRAVKLAGALDEHKRLWAQATDKKQSEWDIPIRATEDIPDDLRAIVNAQDSAEGAITKRDIDGLDKNFQEALYEHIYPKNPAKDTKWVDSRLLGDVWRYPDEPGFGAKFASAFNEFVRVPTLFLRPAYGVANVLGNSGMLLMQSAGAPNNMRKAYQINKRYGEKNARTISALVNEGKSLSFTPEDMVQTRISRTLAHGWNALVDRKFREASWIHWAERMGYSTADDMTRLLDPKTTDKKALKDRTEITRRAKKDMVEFDNLTPFEKNTMRHLVFVYPWVSRSIIWSLRTMVEHPLKTWTLVELGKIGEKEAEKDIGEKVPDWLPASGYFSMYTDDDGNPQVVNPQSINTFAGLNELRRATEALANQTPYAGPEDFSSPALEFASRVYSGRDEFGVAYENRMKEAALATLENLPQVKAQQRDNPNAPDAKPSERPSFVPGGMLDVYGPLVVGGFWPRTPDQEALAADWMRDQPKEMKDARKAEDRAKAIMDRLKIERKAIWEAEKATSEILGKPLPADVRDAIELNMRFADAYARTALFGADEDLAAKGVPQNIALGRSLTALEKRYVQIKTLHDMGRFDDDVRDRLNDEATKAADKGEIQKWGNQFDKDYLHAEALADWWGDRDEVLDIASNAEAYMSDLRQAGLYKGGSGRPRQEDLLEVGRSYVGFARELRARQEETGVRSDLETLDNSLDRAWLDSQDKPVTVDGKKFPSPVRLGWAMKSDEERLNWISDNADASWDTLSDFEKELLGKKPAEGTSQGWVALNSIMDAYRGNLRPSDLPPDFPKNLRSVLPNALPLGEREIAREDKIKLAKYVDKHFAKGFYRDFLFSLEPKYHRLSYLPIITKSKAAKEWKELLGVARGQFAYIRRSRELDYNVPYTITGIQDEWDDYAKNALWPYIKKNGSETFRNEIELLGGVDLLRTLIADG